MTPKDHNNLDNLNDPGTVNDPPPAFTTPTTNNQQSVTLNPDPRTPNCLPAMAKPKKYTLSFSPSTASDNGLESLNRPLTFDDVWKMFQETNKQFKETDKKLKESFRETREQMKAAAEQSSNEWKEIHRRSKETQQKLDTVSKIMGGIGISIEEVTEDFFKGALKDAKNLAGINYNYVGTLEKSNGSIQGEYDIVLFGEDTIVIVEVKHKLQPADVADFHQRRLPRFKTLFPEYNDKKLIGALAGMTIVEEAAKKALSLGYLVLTQAGQTIKVLAPGD
jgi:hypothetical protein